MRVREKERLGASRSESVDRCSGGWWSFVNLRSTGWKVEAVWRGLSKEAGDKVTVKIKSQRSKSNQIREWMIGKRNKQTERVWEREGSFFNVKKQHKLLDKMATFLIPILLHTIGNQSIKGRPKVYHYFYQHKVPKSFHDWHPDRIADQQLLSLV